jgi:hypothetical protein
VVTLVAFRITRSASSITVDRIMALRTRARVLLAAAGKDRGASGPEKTSSLFENVRKRVVTGKLLRPDVVDDTLRLPVDQTNFRFPSPG